MADKPPPWLQFYSTLAETSTTSMYSHVRNAPSAQADQQPWERDVPAGKSNQGDEIVARRDKTRVDHRESGARRDLTQTGKRANQAAGGDKRLVSRRKKARIDEREKDEREIKLFGKYIKLAPTDQEIMEKAVVDHREQDVILEQLASSNQIAQEKAGSSQRVLGLTFEEMDEADQRELEEFCKMLEQVIRDY